MDSAIGQGLRQSPRLLVTTTAVAVAILVPTLILTTPSGQKLDPGRGAALTLAMIGCLCLGFVGSHVPGTAGALGFRLAPRQGWLYWLWVSPAIGAIQLIVLIIWGQVFPGMSLGRPEALTWHRFLSSCVIAPVAEEILYRMIICPPAVALAGSWGGIVISGVIFACAHLVAGVASPDNQMGGFVLAWVYVKSETIILPIALHSVSNLLLLCLALLLAGAPTMPSVPAEKKHPAEEKVIRSTNSDIETRIAFVNKSEQTIKVYWLDSDGQRKLIKTVKDGDSYDVERTYLTHPWLITDENDKAWYVYFPDAQPRTVEVAAPAKQ